MDYSARLHKVIPAGCHTYSRGDECFPANAPQLLTHGKGAYIYDAEGKEYLDYGMGLRAVTCGYSEPAISNRALDGILAGNCLTRPSLIELEAAELACSLLDMDMVKFTKNGSTATTAAVKLARAATGRDGIACAKQPFFSYDDWFIWSTKRKMGIPDSARHDAASVFTDIETLRRFAETDLLGAVILEPKDHDLQAIRDLCDKHGIILIFDEMITGFRYDWPSVSQTSGVKPDLACFGKAMANGFSVACVGGKREIMELGARRDMFLASTTHGAEMCGLAAFMATVEFMQKHNVSAHIKDYAAEMDKIMPTDVEKTLFMQEMVRNGVLIPYVSPSYRHGEKELAMTKLAIERSMDAIAKGAILEGAKIRPVFSA